MSRYHHKLPVEPGVETKRRGWRDIAGCRSLFRAIVMPYGGRGKTTLELERQIDALTAKVVKLQEAKTKLRNRLIGSREREASMASRIIELEGRVAEIRKEDSIPAAVALKMAARKQAIGEHSPQTPTIPVVQAKYWCLLPAQKRQNHGQAKKWFSR